MLSEPELARLQKQFECEYLAGDDPDSPKNFQNHEQGLSAQKTFQRPVGRLSRTIRRLGNPFLDHFPDLFTLDSCNCVDESVIAALNTLEETGWKQYQDFVKKILEHRTRSIHDPIKKNFLTRFKRPQLKATSKQGKMIKVLQNNAEIFG